MNKKNNEKINPASDNVEASAPAADEVTEEVKAEQASVVDEAKTEAPAEEAKDEKTTEEAKDEKPAEEAKNEKPAEEAAEEKEECSECEDFEECDFDYEDDDEDDECCRCYSTAKKIIKAAIAVTAVAGTAVILAKIFKKK